MDRNLVGYLLDALEPEERRQVEDYIRAHPEARDRLQRLKEMMKPLATDLDTVQPPPGLWVRALGRVAEYQCRPVPFPPSPAPLPARSYSTRGRWRRPDVLVAAGILICLALLVPSGLNKIRDLQYRAACQENLQHFHFALNDYSERHNGRFPNVAEAAPIPRNVAGTFVIVLKDEGFLNNRPISVGCPRSGSMDPASLTISQLTNMPDEEFNRCASSLAGRYAYSLGYWDSDKIRGLRNDLESSRLPIMADRPPVGVALGDLGNSPNHGGSGQNVLFINGSCRFVTTRNVGFQQDDIYLNYDKKVAAGKDAH